MNRAGKLSLGHPTCFKGLSESPFCSLCHHPQSARTPARKTNHSTVAEVLCCWTGCGRSANATGVVAFDLLSALIHFATRNQVRQEHKPFAFVEARFYTPTQ